MSVDPYVPPTAPVKDIPDHFQIRRRPKLVWAISTFYFLGSVLTLVFAVLAFRGRLSLPPELQAQFPAPPTVAYGLAIIAPSLKLFGAVQLFRLRASALIFFGSVVGLAVLSLIYHFAHPSARATLTMSQGLPTLLSLGVSVAVVIYAYHLRVRGTLQ